MTTPSRGECRALVNRLVAAARGDFGEPVRAAAIGFAMGEDLGFAALCLRADLEPDQVRATIRELIGLPVAAAAAAPTASARP